MNTVHRCLYLWVTLCVQFGFSPPSLKSCCIIPSEHNCRRQNSNCTTLRKLQLDFLNGNTPSNKEIPKVIGPSLECPLPVCYWALIITIKVVTYMSKGSKYCLTSPFRKISYKKCLFVTLCLMVLKMFKSRERLKRLHVIMNVYL